MLAGLVVVVFKSIFRVCSTVIAIFYFGYFRPFYKRQLHRLSGKCEIERILSSSKFSTAAKIRKLEYSLKHSNNEKLNEIVPNLSTLESNEDNEIFFLALAKTVSDVKKIEERDRRKWLENELVILFRMVVGYRFLIERVEIERSISYDSKNPEHEEMLLKLWSLLKPTDDLKSRISYQWTEIGFQGDDPATDFRGMGILGLQQLVYFGESRPDRARQLLSKSNHPTIGYPFAIVGISMTSLARDLLREGALKNHFFNTVRRAPKLEDFHRVYCELFSIFDSYWTKVNPASIMQFVPVRHQFHTALRASLSGEEAVLQEAPPNGFVENGIENEQQQE